MARIVPLVLRAAFLATALAACSPFPKEKGGFEVSTGVLHLLPDEQPKLRVAFADFSSPRTESTTRADM
ncbi:MAG: hypothetical protein C4523_01245, partial [Myxococcales bacterium]